MIDISVFSTAASVHSHFAHHGSSLSHEDKIALLAHGSKLVGNCDMLRELVVVSRLFAVNVVPVVSDLISAANCLGHNESLNDHH